MASDWDSGGYGTDAQADAVTIRETRPAPGADADWDIDPDTENYAAGNDPETAYREQGRPGSPDSWSGYDSTETTDQEPEPHENDGMGDPPDLWGDADPDAANYADLDAAATTARHPDQGEPPAADAGHAVPPEQQRISALEAENADARQKIADLEAKNDEQAARLDRIEQLLAGPARQPDAPAPPEHADNTPPTSPDQPEARDAASIKRDDAIAEQEDTDQGMDASDARNHGWRRAASAENVGIAGSLVGAADTVAQFAMHATPEGIVGLGAMALGLASVGLAKLEKNKEKKAKP